MPPEFGFEVQLLYDMLRAEHDRAYLLYLPKRKATEYPLGRLTNHLRLVERKSPFH